jgi:hypothetical protein
MHSLYSSIAAIPIQQCTPVQAGRAAEKKGNYLHISERHLQALWWEQIYFKPLVTASGDSIIVHSPGAWNNSSGPDFQHAHISINGIDYRGAIEIHLTDAGWRAHGHATNAAYDNTILHVALWPTEQIEELYTSQGKSITRVYLVDQLKISLERMLAIIDVDLYPYQVQLGSGKCAYSIFRHLAPPLLSAFFEGAALWRLKSKGQRLLAQTSTMADCWRQGLIQALGLPGYAASFRRLTLWLDEHAAACTPMQQHALCMGISGFFDKHHRQLWASSTCYRELADLWDKLASADTPHWDLPSRRHRPISHPVRRFAALVLLKVDTGLEHLYYAIEKLWQAHWQHCHTQKQWRLLWKKLQGCLPSYSDAYWDHHYLFEDQPSAKKHSLLGTSVKNEMLINVALPLLYCTAILPREDARETTALLQLYRTVAGGGYLKTHFLQQRFLGDTSAAPLFKHAVIEQGALQLHHDFCRHYEMSCHGCPFIERFQKTCSSTDQQILLHIGRLTQ